MGPIALDHKRRDLHELKSRIRRKLGPERSRRYFTYLNRLLAQKLKKYEFDKLCLLTLGPENFRLHNLFIRLILQNACQAKFPPQVSRDKHSFKLGKSMGKKSPSADDWLSSPTVASSTSVLSNGEILSPSPCRSRSTNHKIKDYTGSPGCNGRIETVAYHLRPQSDEVGGRCDSITSTLKTLVQHQQASNEEVTTKDEEFEGFLSHDSASVHHKVPMEVATMEDGEEMAQAESAQAYRDPICAPLGIPFCLVGIDGTHIYPPRLAHTNRDIFATYAHCGELCHTEVLRMRMEKTSRSQGIGGVTMECANLLNYGLDVYLKRLIGSCVEIVAARSGHETMGQPLMGRQTIGSNTNGTLWANHMHVQQSVETSEVTQEFRNNHQVSLLDFRVSLEQSPEKLGRDWPSLLEKACTCSFEE